MEEKTLEEKVNEIKDMLQALFWDKASITTRTNCSIGEVRVIYDSISMKQYEFIGTLSKIYNNHKKSNSNGNGQDLILIYLKAKNTDIPYNGNGSNEDPDDD